MKFSFHPAAAEEFSAAVDWYEMRQPGLGLDFAVEVRAAVSRAMALPNAWVELEPGIRRMLTQRFPSACCIRLQIRACSSWRSCA